MTKPLAALLLLTLPVTVCLADMPVRTEQLIWSAIAFNGRDYSATFAPESSDSLFLLAGVDNFLSLRETLVYWWPITSEWKTDTDSLNIQFPGTLELRDRAGSTRELKLQDYTYFNIRGEYELNWKALTGDAARQELKKYSELYQSYFKAINDYRTKSAAVEAEAQSLATHIQARKDRHDDYSALLQRLKTLPAPAAPTAPTYYAVPPAGMQQGFILNLSPGRYSLRLRNPDGSIMEGSEKSLLVHRRGRSGGVGLEVIPSDRWTRPEQSVTPSSVLYVNGKADLYLRPYFEDEYNDLAYEKTIHNGATGNPQLSKWVRIQQVPHARIETRPRTGARSILQEEPFSVEQSQGNSLGYTIVRWDPNGPHKDQQANLIAFRLPIDGSERAVDLRVMNEKGEPLPGGERQLRVIGRLPDPGLLVAIALSPILLLIVVLVIRSRSYQERSSGKV
jgi:hypothetical protein